MLNALSHWKSGSSLVVLDFITNATNILKVTNNVVYDYVDSFHFSGNLPAVIFKMTGQYKFDVGALSKGGKE